MPGKPPLHLAAEHGRVEEVAVLLADGAKVDATTKADGVGYTALAAAAAVILSWW